MITKARTSPIGLDIRDGGVCAAQLAPTGRGLVARRLADLTLDTAAEGGLTPDSAERLDALLERRGFQGRQVVIAAPRQSVLSSVVSVPGDAEREVVEAIARSDLARNHQLDPNAFELTCWGLPGSSGGAASSGSALACACPHEAVIPTVELLHAAGREVVAVDLESRALARACEPLLPPDNTSLRLIADLGWSSSTVIVMLGTTTLYERTVSETTLGALRADVMSTLNVSEKSAEQAILSRGIDGLPAGGSGRSTRVLAMIEDYLSVIADEIALSIDYAVRRHALSDASVLLLTGPGAIMPGLGRRLAEACDVETSAVRPSDLVSLDPSCALSDDPRMLLAIGLARATERGRP